MQPENRIRIAFDVVAAVAMTVASVVVISAYLRKPVARTGPDLAGTTMSITGAPFKGSPNAPLAIVIFSDFECPFCSQFAKETLPALTKAYVDPGKAILAFRHLPNDKLHPTARLAADAADCAAQEGKFWILHDQLFENPKGLSRPVVNEHLKSLGLAQPLAACLGVPREQVTRDLEEARTLGIGATPTTIVGWRRPDQTVLVASVVRGAQPLRQFTTILDGLLTKSTNSPK